jgi:hypothetical protein
MLAGAVTVVLALVGAAALTSGSAGAQTQAVPKNTQEPRISGSPTVGSTLTASRGEWSSGSSGSPTTLSYAAQWVRCPRDGGKSDGSDLAAIGGATTFAYVVANSDVGRRLRVRVTASNSEGSTTVASNATAVVTGANSGPPRNTQAPSISGTATVGQALHATPGTWTGTQPMTFSFRWLRCDANGNNCIELSGATDDSYTLRDGDIDRTLRVRVAAHNADGDRSKLSAHTAIVQKGPQLPAGAIKLPTGETSIPVTSVPATENLIVDRVEFSPSPVRSRQTPITVRIKIKDSRGFVVRDALVFLRSTPVVTSTPAPQATAQDDTLTYTVQPESDFPIRNGYNVQFFVKAYKQGDNPLGGIAGYRLVQVATVR